MANRLGVSSVQINRYYKSKSLERDTVNRIISAFGVSEEDIWGSGTQEEVSEINAMRDELKELKKTVNEYRKMIDECQKSIMDLQHQSIEDKKEIIRLTNLLHNKSEVHRTFDVYE